MDLLEQERHCLLEQSLITPIAVSSEYRLVILICFRSASLVVYVICQGSELVQKYIGEGSRMVRELFVMAREHAPSIIFMDEVISISGRKFEGSLT